MDPPRIDVLVTQLRAGQLNRRQFLARATTLGLSAGAATALVRVAEARQASPSASPPASPGASPIASSAASGHALTSMTREAYWAELRQAFPLEQPGRQGGAVITGGTIDISTLNPMLAVDAISGLITGLLFDVLVTVSPLDA